MKSSFLSNEAIEGGGAALYIQVNAVYAMTLSSYKPSACQSLESNDRNGFKVEIANSTFLFNQAMHSSRGGGTIGMIGPGTEMNITDCEFSENDAGFGAGGALFLFHGPFVTIHRSNFSRNRANDGGAIYAQVSASPSNSSTKLSVPLGRCTIRGH